MEFEGKILLFKRIGSFKLGFIKWILINEVIFELDRILVFDYFQGIFGELEKERKDI